MSETLSTPDLDRAKERPFPWRCPRCRQKDVWRVVIPYECERQHNGRTVTVTVPNLAVPRCRSCGELVFDYIAEEQINSAFRAVVAALPPAPPQDAPVGQDLAQRDSSP
jgi:hypothetical protein